MYKLFFIAKNNMKKQKGDMITFFILTFIAAFLMLDCASALLGIGKILDERFDQVNGAHVLLINGDTDAETECAEKAFEKNEYIIDYEQTPILKGNFDHRNKKDDEYSQFEFIIESFETDPKYMDVGVKDKNYKENDIVLPYFLKNDFQIGDTFQLKFDKDVYDFSVAGYAETPYFTSSINLTIYYVYVSDSMMDKLVDEHPSSAQKMIMHKGVCDESKFSEDFTTRDVEDAIGEEYKSLITPYAEETPGNDYLNYLGANWQMMRGGSQFVPMIIMAIVLLFAVLILIIAVVVISFSVKNFIERNMKNTGILEASGYTVRELRAALTFQIILVAVLGTIAGVILSVATFKTFGDVVSLVVGLTWNQPVNAIAVVFTFLGILLVVFLVARFVSGSYKKVTVLDALRGGISTHNFRHNFFSFEKTPLPISLVLSLKDTFGGIGRNLIIVLITVILTISALIGFGLYENFGRDPQNLVSFMGFEMGNASALGSVEMGDDLREMEGVKNVLGVGRFQPVVYFNDEKSTVAVYIYDDPKYSLQTRIVEGRLPERDNEVMLTGAVAEDLGVKLGDIIEMEMGSKKKDYLIVGINQRMEQMGRTILMSGEAAERIIPEITTYTYYITTEEGVTFDEIKAELEDYAEENDIDFESMAVTDQSKNMDSIIGTVSGSMKLLCIAIAILTSIIVVFVEALIIRAKITREWRGMGISKALGVTSGGLISQIVLSNAPAIVIGILIGVIVSRPAGAELCLVIFSLFGMKSMDFNLPIIWILLTAVVILVSAIITSGVLGLKVRTLKPVEMIVEE